MKGVDLYLKVRHAVRIEGLSERAAAGRFCDGGRNGAAPEDGARARSNFRYDRTTHRTGERRPFAPGSDERLSEQRTAVSQSLTGGARETEIQHSLDGRP